MNLYGTMERIELALGRHPQQIGQELVETLLRLNPPSLKTLWDSRRVLSRGRFLHPRVVRHAPVQEIVEAPRLDLLPAVTSWPRDGGPFITFGPTLTQDPVTKRRNYGLYRLQVYGPDQTGMHWQSMKGGLPHYEAEHWAAPSTAVVLGGDPSSCWPDPPLPEDSPTTGRILRGPRG
jgi:4-hydroxy-3-polyprenylbenzoate decarboxylase